LLTFTGSTERTSGIGVPVKNAKLLAQATNGTSAVYHHGDASDGEGGKYIGQHEWQLDGESVSMIAKAMDGADEVLFAVDKKGKMTRAIIRHAESSEQRGEFSLAGKVDTQLALEMTKVVPERPQPYGMQVAQIGIAPTMLASVLKVAKAVGTNVCRITVPDDETKPVYVEVDEGGALADAARIRWIVVLAPCRIGVDPAKSADEAGKELDRD
jgi:hypothetical protein